MTDPIAVIRAYLEGDITRAEQALNSGDFMNKNYHAACLRDAKQALAALDQVEGRVDIELPHEIRLYKVDASIKDAFAVWLVRDGKSYDDWLNLPEEQAIDVPRYFVGTGTTLKEAFIAAKAKIEGGGG